MPLGCRLQAVKENEKTFMRSEEKEQHSEDDDLIYLEYGGNKGNSTLWM